MNDLDNVDYAMLKALQEAENPLWKKRLHEYIEEHKDHLPITDGVSVQTVGRRVDQLLADRYVDNLITDPDGLSQDLIIAFKLTDKGQEALDEYRDELLQRVVKDRLFPDEDGISFGKDALLQLMQDAFEFDGDVAETLREYDGDELATFLTIRYAQKKTVDMLDQGHLDEYREILDQHPDVKEALGIQ